LAIKDSQNSGFNLVDSDQVPREVNLSLSIFTMWQTWRIV